MDGPLRPGYTPVAHAYQQGAGDGGPAPLRGCRMEAAAEPADEQKHQAGEGEPAAGHQHRRNAFDRESYPEVGRSPE